MDTLQFAAEEQTLLDWLIAALKRQLSDLAMVIIHKIDSPRDKGKLKHSLKKGRRENTKKKR